MKITPEELRATRETRGYSVLDLALLFQVQTGQIYQAESPIGTRSAGPKLLAMYAKHGLITDARVTEHLRSAGEAA